MTLPIRRRLVVLLVPLAALLSGCASGGEPAAVVCPQPAIIDGWPSSSATGKVGRRPARGIPPTCLRRGAPNSPRLPRRTNGDLLSRRGRGGGRRGPVRADPALDIPTSSRSRAERSSSTGATSSPGSWCNPAAPRRTVESFTQRFRRPPPGRGGYRCCSAWGCHARRPCAGARRAKAATPAAPAAGPPLRPRPSAGLLAHALDAEPDRLAGPQIDRRFWPMPTPGGCQS